MCVILVMHFFVKNEYANLFEIKTPTELYLEFLNNLDVGGKSWLKNVNIGINPPYYKFNNLEKMNVNIKL